MDGGSTRRTRQSFTIWRVPIKEGHVRIFPLPGKEPGLREHGADYGTSMPVLLAKYDRTSQSWKMSQPSLFGDLTGYWGAFPKRGMLHNGMIFELPMWERPTSGNEYGLWRTPSASDGKGGSIGNEQISYLLENNMIRKSGSLAQVNLRDQVRYVELFPPHLSSRKKSGKGEELFPTPCAQDYKHRGPASRQKGLSDVVRMWPTVTARDYKDGSKSSCANVPVRGLLGRAVHEKSSLEGQLSAAWTEALMGYPEDWTNADKDSSLDFVSPQAWKDGSWERGIPRVAQNQQKRRHRIEALGNSIVPQIPFFIFGSSLFDSWKG